MPMWHLISCFLCHTQLYCCLLSNKSYAEPEHQKISQKTLENSLTKQTKPEWTQPPIRRPGSQHPGGAVHGGAVICLRW